MTWNLIEIYIVKWGFLKDVFYIIIKKINEI
jgi:hypothetical protein